MSVKTFWPYSSASFIWFFAHHINKAAAHHIDEKS